MLTTPILPSRNFIPRPGPQGYQSATYVDVPSGSQTSARQGIFQGLVLHRREDMVLEITLEARQAAKSKRRIETQGERSQRHGQSAAQSERNRRYL
jgi:hypothetical protein